MHSHICDSETVSPISYMSHGVRTGRPSNMHYNQPQTPISTHRAGTLICSVLSFLQPKLTDRPARADLPACATCSALPAVTMVATVAT